MHGFIMPKRPKNPASPRYKARMGYEGEYYLVKKFTSRGKPGFYAVRTPGSGAGKLPKPDIIAVDDGELLAIEVKSSNKSYIALNEAQVKRLLEFCKRFVIKCPRCGEEIRPKPILAARFLGKEWRFVEIPPDWEGVIIVKRFSRSSEASHDERLSSPPHERDEVESSRGKRGRAAVESSNG